MKQVGLGEALVDFNEFSDIPEYSYDTIYQQEGAILNYLSPPRLEVSAMVGLGKAASYVTGLGSAKLLGVLGTFGGRGEILKEASLELNRFRGAAKALPKEAQQNIRILRGWAKSKGYIKLPNPKGGPEVWGVIKNGKLERRVVIKPEPSFRKGIHPISNKPRFESRLEKGGNNWVNPFTGEVGSKNVGAHIWLENPYLSYEQQLNIVENTLIYQVH